MISWRQTDQNHSFGWRAEHDEIRFPVSSLSSERKRARERRCTCTHARLHYCAPNISGLTETGQSLFTPSVHKSSQTGLIPRKTLNFPLHARNAEAHKRSAPLVSLAPPLHPKTLSPDVRHLGKDVQNQLRSTRSPNLMLMPRLARSLRQL